MTTSDKAQPAPRRRDFAPRWRYFPTNPTLGLVGRHTPTTRCGCWSPAPAAPPLRPVRNVQAPGPWEPTTSTGEPTLTTVGNNADTHEAWLSPHTPGGTAQAPVSPTREYTEQFTDAWNNSQCDPTQLTRAGTTSPVGDEPVRRPQPDARLRLLPRLHRAELQPPARQPRPRWPRRRPRGRNAQAGALSGGQPSYLGRDNANQITLQDGTPGITNQYLFQPIAGAFYSPCADGGLDMSVVGHEYTHAISNRMIGGPDEGITSEQGGAMGESWGDLDAGEYMFSHGYSDRRQPWVVGPYATGNKRRASATTRSTRTR